MASAFERLKQELLEVQLPEALRATHKTKLDGLLEALKSSADELKAVEGNSDKLTIQFQEEWDQAKAKLAVMADDFIQEGIDDHNVLRQIVYHDPLTMLKNKAFYGRLLKMVQGENVGILFASADMDYFKIINDKWSHEHGDYAIILASQLIDHEVRLWNEGQTERVLTAFRFGGDEFVFALLLSPTSSSKSSAARHAALEAGLRQDLDDFSAKVRDVVGGQLQEIFQFKGLAEPPRDRDGNPIGAKGPSISIGLGQVVTVCSRVQLHELNDAYTKSDKELDRRKHLNKTKGHQAEGSQELKDVLTALTGDGRPEAKENSAAALKNLAANADNKITIAQTAGALDALVHLLKEGSPVAKEASAGALRNLAANNADNRITIAQTAGALDALVHLLKEGSPVAKGNSAGALKNLAANADNRITIAQTAGALDALVHLLKEGSPVAKENSAGALWGLAANADNKITIAQTAGALDALVHLLKEGSPVAKENSAGALGNLAKNVEVKASISKINGAATLLNW